MSRMVTIYSSIYGKRLKRLSDKLKAREDIQATGLEVYFETFHQGKAIAVHVNDSLKKNRAIHKIYSWRLLSDQMVINEILNFCGIAFRLPALIQVEGEYYAIKNRKQSAGSIRKHSGDDAQVPSVREDREHHTKGQNTRSKDSTSSRYAKGRQAEVGMEVSLDF